MHVVLVFNMGNDGIWLLSFTLGTIFCSTMHIWIITLVFFDNVYMYDRDYVFDSSKFEWIKKVEAVLHNYQRFINF